MLPGFRGGSSRTCFYKFQIWDSGYELPDRYQTDTEFKANIAVVWITGRRGAIRLSVMTFRFSFLERSFQNDIKTKRYWIPGRELLDVLLWVSDLRCRIGASGPMVLGREILGEKLVTWSDRYETDIGPIWKWSLLWKSLQNRYENKN